MTFFTKRGGEGEGMIPFIAHFDILSVLSFHEERGGVLNEVLHACTYVCV